MPLPLGISQESQAAHHKSTACSSSESPLCCLPSPRLHKPTPFSLCPLQHTRSQSSSSPLETLGACWAPSCSAKAATREDRRYLNLHTLGILKRETHLNLRSAGAAFVQVSDPYSGWQQYQCLLQHTYVIPRQNSQVPAPRSLALDRESFGCAAVALIPRLPPPCQQGTSLQD